MQESHLKPLFRESTDVNEAFARVITKERKTREITKMKLAEMSGVSRTNLTYVERGLGTNMNTVGRIIKSLGISWEELGRKMDEEKLANGKIYFDPSTDG